MTITKEGEEVKVTRPNDLKKMKYFYNHLVERLFPPCKMFTRLSMLLFVTLQKQRIGKIEIPLSEDTMRYKITNNARLRHIKSYSNN